MSNKQHRPTTARLRSAKCVTKSKDKLKETKIKNSEKKKTPITDMIKREVAEAKRRHSILQVLLTTSKQPTSINKCSKDAFLNSVLLSKEKILKGSTMEKLRSEIEYELTSNKPLKVEKVTKKSPGGRSRKLRMENNNNKPKEPLREVAEQGKVLEDLMKKFTSIEPPKLDKFKKSLEINKPSEEAISSKFDVKIKKVNRTINSDLKNVKHVEKVNKTMNTDSKEKSGELLLREIDLQTCSQCAKEAIHENVSKQSIRIKRTTSSKLLIEGIKKLSEAILKELHGNEKRKIKIITIDDDNEDVKNIMIGKSSTNEDGMCKNIQIAGSAEEDRTLIQEIMREKMQTTDFITFNDLSPKTIEKIRNEDKASIIKADNTPSKINRISIMSESTSCKIELHECESEKIHAVSQESLPRENTIENEEVENTSTDKNPLYYYITLNSNDSIEDICTNQHETEQVQDKIDKIKSYVEKSMLVQPAQHVEINGDGTLSRILNCLDMIQSLKNKYHAEKQPALIGEQGDAQKGQTSMQNIESNEEIDENHIVQFLNGKNEAKSADYNQTPPVNDVTHTPELQSETDFQLIKNKTPDFNQSIFDPASEDTNRNNDHFHEDLGQNKTENHQITEQEFKQYQLMKMESQLQYQEKSYQLSKMESLQQKLEQIQLDLNQAATAPSVFEQSTSQTSVHIDENNNRISISSCSDSEQIQGEDFNETTVAQTSSEESKNTNLNENNNADNVSPYSSPRISGEEKVHPIYRIAEKLSKISEHLNTLLQKSDSTSLSRCR